MTFFGYLKVALTLLPELIGIIKEAAALAEQGYEWARLKVKLAQFSGALKDAREKKNTADLERLFRGG